jgi:hypothetical protein
MNGTSIFRKRKQKIMINSGKQSARFSQVFIKISLKSEKRRKRLRWKRREQNKLKRNSNR